MAGGDLTNEQWTVREPLLPKGKKSGRPPTFSRRQLIDGIRFRVRTGIPWRDLPAEYGPWSRAYDLFRRRQRDGIWQRIFTALHAQADAKDLHLAVEQRQKPMSIVITVGQRGDSPQFASVLGRVRVPRLGAGQATHPAQAGSRRQGVRFPQEPRPPATRHPLHRTRQGRPGPQPEETRLSRQPAAVPHPAQVPRLLEDVARRRGAGSSS
ncbi:transposase [Streptomyces murinus]|uniref:transposase n=1 Tax=Streptomyces murinus TaxID=33900 RepID=UPI00380C06BF